MEKSRTTTSFLPTSSFPAAPCVAIFTVGSTRVGASLPKNLIRASERRNVPRWRNYLLAERARLSRKPCFFRRDGIRDLGSLFFALETAFIHRDKIQLETYCHTRGTPLPSERSPSHETILIFPSWKYGPMLRRSFQGFQISTYRIDVFLLPRVSMCRYTF